MQPGNDRFYVPVGAPVNVRIAGSPVVSPADVFPEKYGPLGFIPPVCPPPYPVYPYPPYPPRPFGYPYGPYAYPYPY